MISSYSRWLYGTSRLFKIQRPNGSGGNPLRSTLDNKILLDFSSSLLRVGAKLFFVSIAVVDADERAAKGECFAEGDEDRVMDLCQWRADEACHQQEASKRAERDCA